MPEAVRAEPGGRGGGSPTDPGRRRLGRSVHRLPPAWRTALLLTLVLRVIVGVVGLAGWGVVEPNEPAHIVGRPSSDWPGWQAADPEEEGARRLLTGAHRFDALWYLAIARSGYPDPPYTTVPEAYAFFPMFPAAVGMVARLLGGAYQLAGALVAFLATVAALAGVHRLITEETGDERLAGRSVLLLAAFPAAYFLVAPYTESLFLAASAWALVAARRGRWWQAAGLAVVVGATRNLGILLALPLLVEGLRQRRAGRSVGLGGWGAAVVAAPIGLALFWAYAWSHTGVPLAPLEVQEDWSRDWTWPTTTLWLAVESGATPPLNYHTLELVLFAVVAAATGWLLLRTPATYGLYAAAHVLVWLINPWPGRPLMSTYRFALAVAPLCWAFGAWTRSRPVRVGWLVVSGVLLVLMATLFVNWHYTF